MDRSFARRSHVTTALTALAVILFSAMVDGALAAEPDFVVAPNGDDAGPGNAAAPFATPGRAQQAVRQRIAAGLDKNLTVELRAGTYRLEQTLAFTPADGGTETYAVTWRAAPGQRVLLSGGSRLDGWQPGEGQTWTATLPESQKGKWRFGNLFVNGRRAIRARSPNADAEHSHWQLQAVEFDQAKQHMAVVLPEGSVGDWSTPGEIELMIAGNWAINRKLAESVDPAANRIVLKPPHRHGPNYIFPSKGRWCYAENVREALDRPGEWYLDSASGTLTYWPHEGERLDGVESVAPRLERLIHVQGTAERPVRNLHFHGIGLAHTDWSLPEGGYMGIQACHYGHNAAAGLRWGRVSAALQMEWVEHCSIEGCTVAHTGGGAIDLGAGCRNTRIEGNHVFDIAANGIALGGPNVENAVPGNNRIANNLVEDCGVEFYGAIGIWVGFAQDTLVAHNEVHHLPYSGISVGWSWNTNPTVCKRNTVEFNHVYDVMMRLCDGGCIYTLGLQPGTVFRGNHLHDVHRSQFAQGAPNNGMFIDQGSKGYLFEQNVIYNTAAALVRFNQCQREWHTWRDNHFGPKDEVTASGAKIIAEAGLEPKYRQRLLKPRSGGASRGPRHVKQGGLKWQPQ